MNIISKLLGLLTSEQWMSIIRQLISALGTVLITRGLITNDQLQVIISSLLPLISLIWSMITHSKGTDPVVKLIRK